MAEAESLAGAEREEQMPMNHIGHTTLSLSHSRVGVTVRVESRESEPEPESQSAVRAGSIHWPSRGLLATHSGCLHLPTWAHNVAASVDDDVDVCSIALLGRAGRARAGNIMTAACRRHRSTQCLNNIS